MSNTKPVHRPTSFYAVADAFGDQFDMPRIERVQPITTPVYGFSEATLRWARECELELERPQRGEGE